MTLNTKFRRFLAEGACKPARQWVKNRSIVQAWRDCPNACWMVCWLVHQQDVCVFELSDLLNMDRSIFMDTTYTTATLRNRADVLRATYTPSGKRRVAK
jgi:hypothetical protein